jgi:hypothetical protein
MTMGGVFFATKLSLAFSFPEVNIKKGVSLVR